MVDLRPHLHVDIVSVCIRTQVELRILMVFTIENKLKYFYTQALSFIFLCSTINSKLVA